MVAIARDLDQRDDRDARAQAALDSLHRSVGRARPSHGGARQRQGPSSGSRLTPGARVQQSPRRRRHGDPTSARPWPARPRRRGAASGPGRAQQAASLRPGGEGLPQVVPAPPASQQRARGPRWRAARNVARAVQERAQSKIRMRITIRPIRPRLIPMMLAPPVSGSSVRAICCATFVHFGAVELARHERPARSR